jgi:hypothetical protein
MSLFGWRAPGALGQSVSCHRQRADQCRRNCDRGHSLAEKQTRGSTEFPRRTVSNGTNCTLTFRDGGMR